MRLTLNCPAVICATGPAESYAIDLLVVGGLHLVRRDIPWGPGSASPVSDGKLFEISGLAAEIAHMGSRWRTLASARWS
jgi:hypothetical protein